MEPELAPPPALASSVEAIWRYRGGERAEVRRVPPDGCLDLIVILGDGELEARVYGPTSRYDDVTLAPHRSVVGLRFRAGVGALALDARAEELADGGGRLDDLAPRAAAIVRGAATVDDVPDRLIACAGALLARTRPTGEHRRALRAVRAIAAGTDSVAALAGELAVAERTLHRDFLTAVGLAPRRYLRIARARRAAALLAGGAAIAEVAFACGYADQAHLTRELVALHGTTPAALRPRAVRNLQDPARAVR